MRVSSQRLTWWTLIGGEVRSRFRRAHSNATQRLRSDPPKVLGQAEVVRQSRRDFSAHWIPDVRFRTNETGWAWTCFLA
jgi:hypothetical protein